MTNSGTARFGELFTIYRKRTGTQEEIGEKIGLHFSDVSKIERNERKPPKLDHTIEFIRVCNLTTAEAKELLEAGKYPQTALNKIKFDSTVYPKTDENAAVARLRGDRGYWPVWRLTTNGVVVASNLLSFILWCALTLLDTTIDSLRILGFSVFEIYARLNNWSRLAMPEEVSDFLFTKIIVFRKLEEYLSPPAVEAFRKRVLAHPVLSLIYKHGTYDLGEEWSYYLKIKVPEHAQFPDMRVEDLEFEATVERIMDGETHVGFLVTNQPLRETIKVVERWYNHLLDRFGEVAFVQSSKGAYILRPQPTFPAYVPFYVQDHLWNIIDENQAHKLLIGTSAKGMHFFELVLSQSMAGKLGQSFADTTSLTALRKFLVLTKDFQSITHPLHSQYQELMNRLMQQDEFRKLLRMFWLLTTLSSLDEEIHEGEIQCEPVFTSPFNTSFPLSFQSVVYFTRVQPRGYIDALVPKDEETKVTLMLLLCKSLHPPTTHKEQLRWGLVIIQTVQEGLATPVEHSAWNPEDTFQGISEHLQSKLADVPEDQLELQVTITFLEMLLQTRPSAKEHIHEVFSSFFEQIGAVSLHRLLTKEHDTEVLLTSTGFSEKRIV